MRTFSILAFLAVSVSPVNADALRITAFGHQISIWKKSHESELSINQKVLITKEYIELKELLLNQGIPIIIGESGPGGNHCESAPFVLSFPPNAEPRLDGPVGTCSVTKQETHTDRIIFKSPATPFAAGEEWTWTLGDGLSKPRSIPFELKPNGWEAMRTKRIDHPATILDYSDMRTQFDQLVGAKIKDLLLIMSGPGNGKFEGDTFIGSVCQAHNCQDASVLVVAHGPEKKLYLGWKIDEQPINFQPKLAEWPENVAPALHSWRTQYEPKKASPAKITPKKMSPL